VFHSTSFLSPPSFLCPRLVFFAKTIWKNILIDRHQFLLQLLQTCVDSCLICTSTAVTLMLHGCGGSFRPTYVHHVTEFHAFNRTLLAPVTGPFFDVLDRSFAVNGTDAPTLLGVSVGIFRSTSYSTCCRWTHHCAFSSLHQRLLPFNTHSSQLACTESTVTLLRSLQYGSKFGLRPLFADQDQTGGRVLV